MVNEDIKYIINNQNDLKNESNSTLVSYLDKLSIEFDVVKTNIIELTYHLDKVEELYNKILKEYESRNK
jgi:hypothetical protein